MVRDAMDTRNLIDEPGTWGWKMDDRTYIDFDLGERAQALPLDGYWRSPCIRFKTLLQGFPQILRLDRRQVELSTKDIDLVEHHWRGLQILNISLNGSLGIGILMLQLSWRFLAHSRLQHLVKSSKVGKMGTWIECWRLMLYWCFKIDTDRPVILWILGRISGLPILIGFKEVEDAAIPLVNDDTSPNRKSL